MFTRKQHIVRKTLIVATSFLMGATLTLFAASVYDASVQTRATKIFESIKTNASSMNQADSMAYYSLVRMNIKSLIEVLTLVETNLSGEINTGAVSTLTGSTQQTNTGTQATQIVNPPAGWSKVDGPKSIYPKTTEDLKMICKEGYRLPKNAEWENLRQVGTGDLFTKEAQKLGLSSAYYWTQEGDIFYVMNGDSGYLNPVKPEDRERIRSIAHYTRCIASNGTGISAGGSTATTPAISTPTNTGAASTGNGTSPKVNTGVVSAPLVVSENIAGWSRVDGPKSAYPKTPEDLKMICKVGYRLPTNAEWEKLRAPNEGDNFTAIAKTIGFSAAYYWTQEGDMFYSYGNNGGYLIPVKAEDRERIRDIAHNTRCISVNGFIDSATSTKSTNTGAVSTLTGSTQQTNTGTQATQIVNPPAGWSKVDGPKSIYPKTTEDLKMICKEGYRFPTNAEWEKLRQAGAGDLFTKEAQKLGLSSAYYWTQEGDIFYVMNGDSGYLNPVKGDDRERIRNIAHYTRCISMNGTGISAGGSTTSAVPGTTPVVTPDIFNNLGQLVGKELSSPSVVDMYSKQYDTIAAYSQAKNKLKEIEKKTTSNVITKVEDLGNKIPYAITNPTRLLNTWYGFGHADSQTMNNVQRALLALNAVYTSTSTNESDIAALSNQAHGSVENMKRELYIMAPSLCPEGSEVFTTWQYTSYGDTTKQRSNICKVKGQEKYFKVYFGSFPEVEKITQKYTGITAVNLDNPSSSESVCTDTQDVYVFGKKVLGTLMSAELNFDAEMNFGKTNQEILETPWRATSFSLKTSDVRRSGECFATPNGGIYKQVENGFRSMSPFDIEYGLCPGLIFQKGYGQGSFSPIHKLGRIVSISCNYSYTVTP